MRFQVSGFRLQVAAVLGLCLFSFILPVAADNGGRLTTQIIYPVPYSEGKVENVRELVLAHPHGVAVAGFGNSYHTDGPFLRYIATQPSLPGGIRATSVMINGGQPRPGFTEHFKTIDEKDVIGR